MKAKLPEGTVILSQAEAGEYNALKALGKPAKDLKTDLETAQADRAAVVQAGNEKVLAARGIKPSALGLKKLDGAVFRTTGEGDKAVTTVLQGDKEQPWDEWVTAQVLGETLKGFAAAPQGVPVLPQVTGERAGPVTVQQRTEQKAATGDYSI